MFIYFCNLKHYLVSHFNLILYVVPWKSEINILHKAYENNSNYV
jgi:hypothetical protein